MIKGIVSSYFMTFSSWTIKLAVELPILKTRVNDSNQAVRWAFDQKKIFFKNLLKLTLAVELRDFGSFLTALLTPKPRLKQIRPRRLVGQKCRPEQIWMTKTCLVSSNFSFFLDASVKTYTETEEICQKSGTSLIFIDNEIFQQELYSMMIFLFGKHKFH